MHWPIRPGTDDNPGRSAGQEPTDCRRRLDDLVGVVLAVQPSCRVSSGTVARSRQYPQVTTLRVVHPVGEARALVASPTISVLPFP